ncbi:MAG TPA: LAGLIDADG family homing endonuclease [Candidatus Paceibacterota bacterium]|nr:LAGLIDADG family homing endonuclease [Candidatus Paceibacterota bacterium]
MSSSDLKSIASSGGKRRVELHGNPGTSEGRKLGGERSIDTHRRRKTEFRTLKTIKKPRPSSALAELLGIFYGDGHIGEYQSTVVTSSETDLEHAHFIKANIERLFGIQPSVYFRKDAKACLVVVSSKEFGSFMASMGMSPGSKIVNGIKIPQWIFTKRDYARALVRGLIDTDGCVYQDCHRVKGREYRSTCIAFTSASPELTSFVYEALRAEGYHPTVWGRHIRLRRRADVALYAKNIGFSNPKHLHKIRVYSLAREASDSG